ncbi:hypothetical protein ACFJIW_13625 [Tahibacter sp. UC22_41]|uniref:hypothetical protein n=1 Tax=Tahibacter sp. UC22_41 TaxID=3350178 RepID=UPI0036D88061
MLGRCDAHASQRRHHGGDGHACDYRYAQFRLDFSLASVSESVPFVTQMRSDGVLDTSSGMVERHLAPVIIDGGYHYLYRFDAGIRRNDLELRLINAFDGDTSVHQVLDVPASLAIIPDALDYSTGDTPLVHPNWTAASSVSDLLNGAGHRYYHDTSSSSLYVKLLARGDDWHAIDYLSVAAALSGLTSVSITADIGHPIGITAVDLFIDDAPATGGTWTAASYAHTVNLAAGSHIVRLVVTGKGGYTYTALQNLIVGQPAARIDMLQPLQKSTYAAGSVPNLSFSVENWGGSGKHVHWFHNGVDQGDATSGSVVLSGLASGRHDLEVALANADHSIIGVNSRTTIYVTSNGVLADFEEGVDRRSTFQPDMTQRGTMRPRYLFGLRATSALDNTNGDMNAFLTYVDSSGLPLQSRYVLTLAPAQNWTSYGSLEIVHTGKPFALSLLTSSGKISLGSSSNPAGTWANDVFTLPTPRPTNVQGIELIQYGPTLQPAEQAACATNRDISTCFDFKVLNQIRLLP